MHRQHDLNLPNCLSLIKQGSSRNGLSIAIMHKPCHETSQAGEQKVCQPNLSKILTIIYLSNFINLRLVSMTNKKLKITEELEVQEADQHPADFLLSFLMLKGLLYITFALLGV